MKLISLSDFVEEYTAPIIAEYQNISEVAKLLHNLKLISSYTNFLKLPLKLEMFTGETKCFEGFTEKAFDNSEDGIESVLFYQNCFVGIKYEGKQMDLNNYAKGDTIEDLVEHGLELTPSALKQIGL